jgi:hypothetical protein
MLREYYKQNILKNTKNQHNKQKKTARKSHFGQLFLYIKKTLVITI